MDENQKRRIHGTACKVIDPLAFTHAVPQVETFRTAFGQKAAAFVEPGEQPGAVGDRTGVVVGGVKSGSGQLPIESGHSGTSFKRHSFLHGSPLSILISYKF